MFIFVWHDRHDIDIDIDNLLSKMSALVMDIIAIVMLHLLDILLLNSVNQKECNQIKKALKLANSM